MSGSDRVEVRVVAKDEVADGVVSLTLEAAGGAPLPAWGPGAHVDLHTGFGAPRQYSLCGNPGDDTWRLGILRVEDGRGGSAWVHEKVEVGDVVECSRPRNHFALVDASEYLFIAGGIGITPLLPMVATVEAEGRPWRLVYGGRTRSSMAFLDELDRYGDKVTLVPQDELGVIDLAGELGPERSGRAVYSCGPEGLLEALEAVCSDRAEVPHVERFNGAPADGSADEAFEIEVASSGKRYLVGPGQSIIDVLDDAGVSVEFSCREGTCGTCETGVLAGVPEHRDVVLSGEEKAANDCMMICVGRCLEGPLLLDL